MKYDVVLIGGGLSSLVCGISLQRAGKRCLMVSGGQNALHFSSGAFGLLGFRPDGSAVERPSWINCRRIILTERWERRRCTNM